jgi:hypothetical protein
VVRAGESISSRLFPLSQSKGTQKFFENARDQPFGLLDLVSSKQVCYNKPSTYYYDSLSIVRSWRKL